jgi:hypothetical protein
MSGTSTLTPRPLSPDPLPPSVAPSLWPAVPGARNCQVTAGPLAIRRPLEGVFLGSGQRAGPHRPRWGVRAVAKVPARPGVTPVSLLRWHRVPIPSPCPPESPTLARASHRGGGADRGQRWRTAGSRSIGSPGSVPPWGWTYGAGDFALGTWQAPVRTLSLVLGQSPGRVSQRARWPRSELLRPPQSQTAAVKATQG